MVKLIRLVIVVLVVAFLLIQVLTYLGETGTIKYRGIFGQVVPGSTQAENFCDDTDNGFNVNKKGSCTDSSGIQKEDSCETDVVSEYVCKEFKCSAIKFQCPFGCLNGACLGS